MVAQAEPICGRYWPLDIQGHAHRVYVEEAGAGIPLLCLHTAGADARQYRHLLNDPEVCRRFRVIAFDLPWHGKSSPPEGFQDERYLLSPELYMDSVMAVVRGLGLERPVVMGCSIGGRAVLHLLIHHAESFAAAIGLQSSRAIVGVMSRHQREAQYLDRVDVHSGDAAAALVSGIMAPQSPSADRWETLWHYMQGGPGVMHGDTWFYKDSGNLTPEDLGRIDTARTPLYLLTGEYDYGATPAHGEEVARQVRGAHFQVMEHIGHFPPSENYPVLRRYLLPILDELERRLARPTA
ncbi:MAG: alpha/beta hydrolase [Gammaproteobacteria bacterium]|nr:alpha/beta hydrolase [Gammaproteobacteria bacterium]MBU1440230.1 alpha/beta hydrolase [Gammaproteobacteria bacterium]MBU2288046.1 alpha/beta hydrolase [Gammaproteobacteria bacterium]MBU2411138.1 alpha/beta hydrolase [Gammaproteobacteria bacterium]